MKVGLVPEVRQISTYLKRIFIFIESKQSQGEKTRKSGRFQLKMLQYFLGVLYNWIGRIRRSWGELDENVTEKDKMHWKAITYIPDEDESFIDALNKIDALNNVDNIHSPDMRQMIKEIVEQYIGKPSITSAESTPLPSDCVEKKEKSKKKKSSIVSQPNEEANETDVIPAESAVDKLPKYATKPVKKESVHSLPKMSKPTFNKCNRAAFAIMRETILNSDPNDMPNRAGQETLKFIQFWFRNKVSKYTETLSELGMSKEEGQYVYASDYPKLISQMILYLFDGTQFEDDFNAKLTELYDSVTRKDKNWKYLVPWSARKYGSEADQPELNVDMTAVYYWNMLYEHVFYKVNDKLVKAITLVDPDPYLFYPNDPQMIFEDNGIKIEFDETAWHRRVKYLSADVHPLASTEVINFDNL